MEQQLINLLMYTIPALVTGAMAYLFFKEQTENENNRRNFLITKELKKEAFQFDFRPMNELHYF